MIDSLRAVWRLFKQERIKAAEAAEKRAIARAFNARYTYRTRHDQSDRRFLEAGHRWMCPECNAIHAPISCSLFSGLQFPKCCSTPLGDRLGRGIKDSDR